MIMFPDVIYKIIFNHVGAIVSVVYWKDGKINAVTGRLQNATVHNVMIKPIASLEAVRDIPMHIGPKRTVFAIYNQNNIDLLKAKEAISMDRKMKERKFRIEVTNRVKQFLNKEFYIIHKAKEEYFCTDARFKDMGIDSITLLFPPFYNKEHILKYNVIYNIFDNDCVDLLDDTNFNKEE